MGSWFLTVREWIDKDVKGEGWKEPLCVGLELELSLEINLKNILMYFIHAHIIYTYKMYVFIYTHIDRHKHCFRRRCTLTHSYIYYLFPLRH